MAAGDSLNGRQFGEMSREEFESQPGTFFHGTMHGEMGGNGGPVHVGTRRAAVEALSARTVGGHVADPDEQMRVIQNHQGAKLFSGRIVGPMSNRPMISPKRGPGNPKWEVAAGIPKGEMSDWKRVDPQEAMSDVRANAIQHRIKKQGAYYVNASEDAGSISAVLPNRQHFKTYEDYQREAKRP